MSLASQSVIQSPWDGIRALLGDIEPGDSPIDMTIGEPRHPMPGFLMETMAEAAAGFGQYPPIRGTSALRHAISAWIARRYGVSVDAETSILALNGSREGLYSAVVPAVERRADVAKPAVLIPNPFYQCYAAAALAAGTEAVFLPALRQTHFLPCLDTLEQNTSLIERTVAFYLCSPANPQGTLADAAYIKRALDLARRYNFTLFADECYSEIYDATPPAGALEVALADTGSLDNLIVFNSLSKRSNLPGLRSGFCAGDPEFVENFARFRNVTCPQVPTPIQHASAALWADESHVEDNRALYRAKFDAADRILGERYGYQRPGGAFFLWLDMAQFGGSEAATVTLWKGCGVKILPGAYLCRLVDGEPDPGSDFVRLALVHDLGVTEEALTRLISNLS